MGNHAPTCMLCNVKAVGCADLCQWPQIFAKNFQPWGPFMITQVGIGRATFGSSGPPGRAVPSDREDEIFQMSPMAPLRIEWTTKYVYLTELKITASARAEVQFRRVPRLRFGL